MIHPELAGVRTLIFDMDGTLIRSGRIALRALRGGLNEFYTRHRRCAPPVTDERLLSGIGAPSDVFYRGLLDESLIDHWCEFREIIFRREHDLLAAERVTFPGALRTLDLLRSRGYRLALVSNCGSPYLNAVLDTQSLRGRFEITACIGDRDGSTKTELIGEMHRRLGGRAAVIGDRAYDVEAARANGLPAVGALYGYGSRDELADTATWVEDVRHLLHLFNPVRELAAKIADRINERRPLDRPHVLALDTPHEALSFPLTGHLITQLTKLNVPATHVLLEAHRLPAERAGDDESWLRAAYPWDRLTREVLAARRTGAIDTTLPLAARPGADPAGERPLRARAGAVVIVEGSFLLGDWAGDTYDTIVRIDARPGTVTRTLRSANTLRAHAERCGAQAVPPALLDPAPLREEWRSRRAAMEQFYRRMLREHPSLELDAIVDGNELQRGQFTHEDPAREAVPPAQRAG